MCPAAKVRSSRDVASQAAEVARDAPVTVEHDDAVEGGLEPHRAGCVLGRRHGDEMGLDGVAVVPQRSVVLRTVERTRDRSRGLEDDEGVDV